MWRQHLFSARIAGPGGQTVDGFHTLTEKQEGDYKSVERILRRPSANKRGTVAFIQDCGEHFYIGVAGRVSDVLGDDNPYAHEMTKSREGIIKGRPITFVQGYFAHKADAEIPNIQHLMAEYPKHLEDILTRANAGEDPVRTSPVRFARRSPSGGVTAWDKFAKELTGGQHLGQAATFTHDGNILEWLEPQEGTFASKIRSEIPFPKKTTPLEGPQKLAFLPMAAITIGVMTAGWLIWELVKSMTNQGQAR